MKLSDINSITITKEHYSIEIKYPPFKREATKKEKRIIEYVQKRIAEEEKVLSKDYLFYVRIQPCEQKYYGGVQWDIINGKKELKYIILDVHLLENEKDLLFVLEHEFAHAYDREDFKELPFFIFSEYCISVLNILIIHFLVFISLIIFLERFNLILFMISGFGLIYLPQVLINEMSSLNDIKKRTINQLNEFYADKKAYKKTGHLYTNVHFFNSYTHPGKLLRIFSMKFFPLVLNIYKQDGPAVDVSRAYLAYYMQRLKDLLIFQKSDRIES